MIVDRCPKVYPELNRERKKQTDTLERYRCCNLHKLVFNIQHIK